MKVQNRGYLAEIAPLDCNRTAQPSSDQRNPRVNKYITIFREETISALAGYNAAPLSWLNWNLDILVLAEGRKPENPAKNPGIRRGPMDNKRNPNMAQGRNRTQATLAKASALATAPFLLP